jgi:hypothetical protein
MIEQQVFIDLKQQQLFCYDQGKLFMTFPISSGANGAGEIDGSGCTPRGWHQITQVIGLECPINAVFVARNWTGEIYSDLLAQNHPKRDWILTRIIRIQGLEAGRNLGEKVDSFNRYIYIHGTPDSQPMSIPKSHGCIRMRNKDVVKLASWVQIGTKVFIDNHFSSLRMISIS